MAESSDAASIADARRGNQQEEAAGNEVGTKANVSVARPSRERKRLERSALLHSMTVDERRRFIHDEAARKANKAERMARAAAPGGGSQRLALDLSFDAIMNDKEVRSLSKQLKLAYGSVKQMRDPFQLVLCDPSDALLEALARFSADRWAVQWRHGGRLPDHFDPSELVYLSPDSPNPLEALDPTKTYVIGGIVDKSRKKGATLETATSAGIATARLPIQEHITERLDHILNVNTVVDVLIAFEREKDWGRALTAALPQRKMAQLGRKARKRRQQGLAQSAFVPSTIEVKADDDRVGVDDNEADDEAGGEAVSEVETLETEARDDEEAVALIDAVEITQIDSNTPEQC